MSTTAHRPALAIVSLVGFVVVVVVNALATTLALGGITTGQLSDLYPNLFVPAGLTFSIWGVIYLLLAIYVVRGVVVAGRAEPSSGFLDRIGVLFIVTCVANAGWIFAWQYRVLLLSLLAMLVLLVSLILIYLRLNIGRSSAPPAEKYTVHLPMSIYLGWISVATIANVTAVLVYYKWNGFGASQQAWAIAMIIVAVALGLVMLFYRRDIFYALVIDWAMLGIYIKRSASAGPPARGVVIASIVGLCLLTAGMLVQLVRRKIYR